MIKRSIQQEYNNYKNIYAPNRGALKYIKQMLTNIKGKTDSNNGRDFNTSLTSLDISSRQKINK